MPNTAPNQRIIYIHRERVASDFLGIKNENWQAACRTLGAYAAILYLYLAANKDNFQLALSPVAVAAAIGMPKSTYHDQFTKLVNYGYLVPRGNNSFDFYETPQPTRAPQNFNPSGSCAFATDAPQGATAVQSNPSEDTEIYINNTDMINSALEKPASPTPTNKPKVCSPFVF